MEGATESFLTALARPQPDPGGGAAAAFGASLALALLEKIVRLELTRHPRGSGDHACWQRLIEDTLALMAEMDALRREDSLAYAALSRALASPHRRTELAPAFELAIACPEKIMEKARRGLTEVQRAGAGCKKHLVADLQVACEFLQAAVKGAHDIALANLHLIKDAPEPDRHRAALADLLRDCNVQYIQTRQKLASRLKPA